MGSLQAFYGFNVENPQHLLWLKRKLARKQRYEKRMQRISPQASGLASIEATPGAIKRVARHLQSRKPAESVWWNTKVVVDRDGVEARPVLRTRAYVFHYGLTGEQQAQFRRETRSAGAP